MAGGGSPTGRATTAVLAASGLSVVAVDRSDRGLQDLPDGVRGEVSRLEIARDLSVSPNTVSTHIRSIYTKLGVRDRSSAVQRARELRLLAAGRTR